MQQCKKDSSGFPDETTEAAKVRIPAERQLKECKTFYKGEKK